jgi:hypothetical protein
VLDEYQGYLRWVSAKRWVLARACSSWVYGGALTVVGEFVEEKTSSFPDFLKELLHDCCSMEVLVRWSVVVVVVVVHHSNHLLLLLLLEIFKKLLLQWFLVNPCMQIHVMAIFSQLFLLLNF